MLCYTQNVYLGDRPLQRSSSQAKKKYEALIYLLRITLIIPAESFYPYFEFIYSETSKYMLVC